MSVKTFKKKARALIALLVALSILLMPISTFAGESTVEAPEAETTVLETTAADVSAAEVPASEAPAAETTTTEAPVVETTTTEAPVVETTTTEAPAAETTAAEAPVAEATAPADSSAGSNSEATAGEGESKSVAFKDEPAAGGEATSGTGTGSSGESINSQTEAMKDSGLVTPACSGFNTETNVDSESNCFVVDLDVMNIAAVDKEIRLMFSFFEIGESNIGEASIHISEGFTYDTNSVIAINDQYKDDWSGSYDPDSRSVVFLRNEGVEAIEKGDDPFRAIFSVTTPENAGAYEFTTTVKDKDGDINQMATGYSQPVVNVSTGSANPNPHEVANAWQLYDVRNHLDDSHLQIADIDLEGSEYTQEEFSNKEIINWKKDQGNGWEPIGTTDPFTGSFDGNDFEISNLFIDREHKSGESKIGLFGETGADAHLANITLEDVAFTGGWIQLGSLVGLNRGTVENCHATGAVLGRGRTGGLVGENLGLDDDIGIVIGSSFSGTVTGHTSAGVGGLIGWNAYASIADSHSTGTVTSTGPRVGGLVGYNMGSSITESYAEAIVTGTGVRALGIGGLVGQNDDAGAYEGSIVNSYAIGTVEGPDNIGGLVGHNKTGATITNSFASAEIIALGGLWSGPDYYGGLVGWNEGSVEDSYFDESISGSDSNFGGGGTPKTTADMKDIVTFSPVWNIVENADYDGEIWFIDDGNDYPRLGWEYPDPDPEDLDPTDPPPPAPLDPPVTSPDPVTGIPGYVGDFFDFPGFDFPGLPEAPPAPPAPPVPPAPVTLLIAPEAPLVSPELVTVTFVTDGTAEDLAEVIEAYNQALAYFDENWETMEPGEYASMLLDLATAWAAIQVLEAKLAAEAGDEYTLETAVEAYEQALAYLEEYAADLTEAQLDVLNDMLEAIAMQLAALDL